jgi:Domain of unknown function (DUF6531)
MIRYLLGLTFLFTFSLHGTEETIRKCFETATENTEGMPSGIVHGCVSVISGDFIDSEVDIELPGPQPLALQRVYSSSDRSNSYLLNGWTLD